MATINSLSSSQYYSLLANSQSGNTKNQQANSAGLLGALTGSSGSSANVNDEMADSGAYQLTLSAEAKAYLAALNNGTASTTTEDSSISLTTQQFQQVKDIVSKYADAPFTQDTFNQIQDDLEEAGLSGRQLAVKDQMSSFNSTSTLLAALDGTGEMPAVEQPADILASIQSKSDSYMKKVESLWRALSSTAPAES